MLTKVISGFQSGIDAMGVRVARSLGLATGGTTTPDFGQENGVKAEFAAKAFGIRACTQSEEETFRKKHPGLSRGQYYYLPRTELNVQNSDATVYFATELDSAGAMATERFAKEQHKPFFMYKREFTTAEQLIKLLKTADVKVLNVAGNRGSKISNVELEQFSTILRLALTETMSTPF